MSDGSLSNFTDLKTNITKIWRLIITSHYGFNQRFRGVVKKTPPPKLENHKPMASCTWHIVIQVCLSLLYYHPYWLISHLEMLWGYTSLLLTQPALRRCPWRMSSLPQTWGWWHPARRSTAPRWRWWHPWWSRRTRPRQRSWRSPSLPSDWRRYLSR